ncbi:MAG TPA: hypothetical protein VL947_08835 [Cytophagales bacterium]|nr:hypothetical protein [Cytophagales bacterium]
MTQILRFLVAMPALLLAQVITMGDTSVPLKPEPTLDHALKFKLSKDGIHWFQITFMNQTWLRYNRSNEGTTVKGNEATETFDIGLRRTRIQMFGQVTDRAFIYFQFGQNNFNYLSQNAGNRKMAAFFHDAVCEYRFSRKNELKVGAGLTIANGLSRFSQPSVSTIATLDVPVFAQATVDQVDMFSRKLSIYARGQLGKIDYRFSLSDPFPVSTNGTAVAKISPNATFADSSHHKQYQGYVMYQFFEHEAHTTPYMTGTYLGNKKIFNMAAGAIYQSDATHRLEGTNVIYEPMKLWALESFLDLPLNIEKKTALHAYVGFFNFDFGQNYVRFNGSMNPADGIKGVNSIAGAQGNAFPMMGTGHVLYSQLMYLLPKAWLGTDNTSQLSAYGSIIIHKFERIGRTGAVHTAGITWHINAHKAKITAEVQNRPTYLHDPNRNNALKFNNRKSCFTLQYQLFI